MHCKILLKIVEQKAVETDQDAVSANKILSKEALAKQNWNIHRTRLREVIH